MIRVMQKRTPETLPVEQKTWHVYQLYGLCLKSTWPLPCPAGRASDFADVELAAGSDHFFNMIRQAAEGRLQLRRLLRHAKLPNGDLYICWPDLFECVVTPNGCRINGRPLTQASAEAFQTYLLGQMLSFALLKHGREPLHATVLLFEGQAVGFLGDSGYGKSTLAASLLQAGHPLLTDDVLVLKQAGDGWATYPGINRIKLFPETAKSLLGEGVNGTPMNHLTSKLIIPLDRSQTSAEAVPLKAMYVLNPPGEVIPGDQIAIRPLSGAETVIEIIKNTYNTVVTEPERLRRQLSFATQIANQVPVKLLSYPRKLELLPAVRKAILADLVQGEKDG